MTLTTPAPTTPVTDLEAPTTAVVEQRAEGADGVVVLTLRPLGPPRPWEPGAHIDVETPAGPRQYSLCGDPASGTWRIAVLREPAGRGGSAWVHDALHAGAQVQVRGPRNHFPLAPAARYLFVAGGIGVTPILPMVAAAEAAGAEWRLVYGGRTRSSMAFTGELADPRVVVHPQDEAGLLPLDELLGTPQEGTLVYCCGPEPLLDAVEQRCAGWPAGALRIERFTPKQLAEPVRQEAFEVELVRTGVVLTVPPERSVLDVVEEAGVAVLSSCSEGTCGTCETPVLDGVVEHRDSVLTAEEHAVGDCMMICVSRAACARLVLDL